jgi:NAD(P)-dependent dehydrogenase (short-subunit alcohol dehydrogenase family)
MGRLAGKVAIVTGGASGIGEAAVHLFAAEGAMVVIADLHEGGLPLREGRRCICLSGQQVADHDRHLVNDGATLLQSRRGARKSRCSHSGYLRRRQPAN